MDNDVHFQTTLISKKLVSSFDILYKREKDKRKRILVDVLKEKYSQLHGCLTHSEQSCIPSNSSDNPFYNR